MKSITDAHKALSAIEIAKSDPSTFSRMIDILEKLLTVAGELKMQLSDIQSANKKLSK